MNKLEYKDKVPISKENICITRDIDKCIKCGACKGICRTRIGVYGNYDMKKAKTPICVYCGQCSLICPTKSIHEVYDYKKVKKLINSNKNVIIQIAPATRFLVGDEFGYKPGKNVQGKLVRALRKLGFKYVVDTTYGADLTILEEANELIERLRTNKKLPLMTSCCPAWVKYVETFYPKYKNNLSSCKSPTLMMGAILKKVYAPKKEIDKPIVVALVPCTAKKYEITKTDDVDYALTVREIAKWIKEEHIDFRKLENDRFDDLTGSSSGMIFGTSGGVTEAMLRYVYHRLTGNHPPKKILSFTPIRGLEDVKEAIINIKNMELSIAVINGTGDVPKIIEKMEQEHKHYDVIEVMACDGGCIAGGGGPKNYKITNNNKNARSTSIYYIDRVSKYHTSYENKKIKRLYKELGFRPNSEESRRLLHMEVKDE